MTNLEINRKIQDKMIAAGYEYTGSSCQTASTFEKAYAEVEICFEMCVCHGGRISIIDKHTNSYHRIEHECYDESLGITDPESELLWEIDNEMMEYVNKFYNKMTFKLVYPEGQCYSSDKKEESTYFLSEDEAFAYLTEKEFPEENLHSFTEGIIDYPNKSCHKKVTRIYKEEKYSWDKNKYWFKIERTSDNWETKSVYEAYISVFEK